MEKKTAIKICLITPGHISSNPRLVKEAIGLSDSGYQVYVIFTQYMAYQIRFDLEIIKNNPAITFESLRWNESFSFKQYLVSGIKKMIWLVNKLSKKPDFCLPLLLNRNYYWQLKKGIKAKADIYIGHNLGALAISINAAKKNHASCGFDAEDFHRQETNNNHQSTLYKVVKSIEDQYLPQLDYLTAASPLIANAYKNLYLNLQAKVINNVFPKSLLKNPQERRSIAGLKLFWFSQTIGKGRGLEDAIKAIGLLQNPSITLTLLGDVDEQQTKYLVNIATEYHLLNTQLLFIKPVQSDQIFEIANQHDVGLALERDYPLNRDICLTNKIFTYLTSGIAVIASETSAQKAFLQQYPKIGKSYPIGNIEVLASIIDHYANNPIFLSASKNEAYKLAEEKFNWENEMQSFLKSIDHIGTKD